MVPCYLTRGPIYGPMCDRASWSSFYSFQTCQTFGSTYSIPLTCSSFGRGGDSDCFLFYRRLVSLCRCRSEKKRIRGQGMKSKEMQNPQCTGSCCYKCPHVSSYPLHSTGVAPVGSRLARATPSRASPSCDCPSTCACGCQSGGPCACQTNKA